MTKSDKEFEDWWAKQGQYESIKDACHAAWEASKNRLLAELRDYVNEEKRRPQL